MSAIMSSSISAGTTVDVMLKEFAVEPAAVGATARDFHQLIDLFGFHRGRAIARCPANWDDEVARLIDRSEQVSDVTRAALLAKLRRARKWLRDEQGPAASPGFGRMRGTADPGEQADNSGRRIFRPIF
jgi:hypothetical protein